MHRTHFFVLIIVILISSVVSAGTVLQPSVIGTELTFIGQPMLMASEDGSHLYAVMGRADNGRYGFVLYLSTDGGTTWSKKYDSVWSDTATSVDAVVHGGFVYVAQIDSWTATSQNWELYLQRFDAEGVRDSSFGGSGTVSVSLQTNEITDVSLVAGDLYLDIFWISDSLLKNSYYDLSGFNGLRHSDIGIVTAYGSLDVVAMSGQTVDFFAAFEGVSNEVTGWIWKLTGGRGLVDITPNTSVFPSGEEITVSSFGSRVEVGVGLPYGSAQTTIYSMWSDGDAATGTWNEEVLVQGWDAVGIHAITPSVVTGPDQTIATMTMHDSTTSVSEGNFKARDNDGTWSPSPEVFTSDTDSRAVPMGLLWSPEGAYMAVYYSLNPNPLTAYFTKLPQIMQATFDDGDLGVWTSVVSN